MPTRTRGRVPFVSKLEILESFRPGAPPSESAFRTLRARGHVSAGASVRVHRHGRISGQLRCYAALNLDAVVLARHGDTKTAAKIAKEADKFEKRWAHDLTEAILDLDIDDDAEFAAYRASLAELLRPAVEQQEAVRATFEAAISPALREQFVRVADLTKDWATLDPVPLAAALEPFSRALAESTQPALGQLTRSIAESLLPVQNAAAKLVVDAVLTQHAHLKLGDFAFLRIERNPGVSFVSLIGAVDDDKIAMVSDADLDAETAAYFRDEPLPDEVRASLDQRRAEGRGVTAPSGVVVIAS